MTTLPRTLRALAALLVAASAQAHTAGEEMSKAANAFLGSLKPEQKAKAAFKFDDAERTNWIFVPSARKGLPLKEMNPGQRHFAQAVLSVALSGRGHMKAEQVMALEHLLFELEGGSGPKRDAENYFVSIFGAPDAKGTWGFRWEGHHLSLNFTLVNGELVSSTPSFFASNPGKIKDGQPGPVGFELLEYEDDLGRQLAKSLTAEQRKKGFLNKDPFKDIVTGNKQKADGLIKHTGIPSTELTLEQRQMLARIIFEYVSRTRPDFASRELQAIDAVKDQIVFAWNGGLEVGEPHYYSIQGPTFLFEMANFQGGANHVHASWRDLKKDFAYDPLREHAKEHAAGK
ncbi:MAG: hypothetical protein RJA37_811 [Verrucomicrobiota bacterium]|jgi:hypothetical protein